jgi:hypothetical protein
MESTVLKNTMQDISKAHHLQIPQVMLGLLRVGPEESRITKLAEESGLYYIIREIESEHGLHQVATRPREQVA